MSRSVGSRYVEASAVHVCHATGNDSNDGSIAAPVRSIQHAANLAAAAADKTTVVLRDGVHYIADTITLTAEHSNLNFMSYPGVRENARRTTCLNTRKRMLLRGLFAEARGRRGGGVRDGSGCICT